MIGARHLFVGFVASAFLHLALLLMWLRDDVQRAGSVALGESGLVVSVGLAGTYTESAKESKQKTTEEPESEPEPEPEPELEPKPKPEPKQELELEPKSEPIPEEIAEKVKDKNSDVVEKMVEPSSKASISAQRATGAGDRIETGGNVGVQADYETVLVALIAKQKRYPRSARKEGVTGMVTVRFTVHGNGKIKRSKIATSSGDLRLDQEALAMLERASPLPPIPSELGINSLVLTLPIEFSLKKNRRLF